MILGAILGYIFGVITWWGLFKFIDFRDARNYFDPSNWLCVCLMGLSAIPLGMMIIGEILK